MWQNILQSFQERLDNLTDALSFASAWAIWAALLAGVFAVALVVHAGALAFLNPILRQRRPYLNRIFTATKNPTRLSFLLIALAVALPAAPLGPDSKLVFVRCLVLATICLIGWTALKALHIGANLYLRNFHTDVPDNLLARKHVTQVRVLVRALDTIIVLLTLGFALMTFDTVRQYGISLFASAPPPRSPRASGPHRRQRSKCEWRRMIFAIQAIHIRSRTIAAGTGSQLCCYRAL
jgi:hypothetical protein